MKQRKEKKQKNKERKRNREYNRLSVTESIENEDCE